MRIERRSWLGLTGLAVTLGVLAGCPGQLAEKDLFLAALEDAGDTPSDAAAALDAAGPCADVVTRIFPMSCGGTGCHSATAPQQDLDLVSPGVAMRVVGVAGKACVAVLADPQNPQASLLYTKLSNKPPCGAQMPLARPPLSAEDTACVLAWIAAQ